MSIIKTKVPVTVAGSDAVRLLTPYAYAGPVKSLEMVTSSRVSVDGVRATASVVTGGKGKGIAVRRYTYFMLNGVREWFEITESEAAALAKDPAFTLELTTVAVATPAVTAPEVPKEEPAPTPEAPKKGKQAKRVPQAA